MTSGPSSNPPPYSAAYTAEFAGQLESREFRSIAAVIREKCALILGDPYGACRSERLRHELSGKRSAQVDRGVRLIYTICEECRRLGDEERNQLDCCLAETCDLTRVTFLTITRHYR